jgi:uncharacterized protein (UPF0335 family)
MEVKILQIPESQFNELISKIDRLQENQNRIFDIAQEEHLFDTKYLQDLLNVSQKTMQGFRDKGDIEFIQIGGLTIALVLQSKLKIFKSGSDSSKNFRSSNCYF